MSGGSIISTVAGSVFNDISSGIGQKRRLEQESKDLKSQFGRDKEAMNREFEESKVSNERSREQTQAGLANQTEQIRQNQEQYSNQLSDAQTDYQGAWRQNAKDRQDIKFVLKEFSEWVGNINNYIWGHGDDFDCVILDNAYKCCGIQTP